MLIGLINVNSRIIKSKINQKLYIDPNYPASCDDCFRKMSIVFEKIEFIENVKQYSSLHKDKNK